MKIVVTGANGLVGKAVTRVCAAKNDDVVALPRAELDITDPYTVEFVIEIEKPDAIINCAAYTDVDGAESDASECYEVNEIGVGNLAAAAKQFQCGFVTISTDFVFDGEKEGFYTEEDKPNPQSVYGKSKLAGERAAFAAFDQSVVVRTGWVFGPGGTNFLSVLPRLLKEKTGIAAITDSYGTPTYSLHLAVRLRELAFLNRPGIYHVANSGSGTSYHGFTMAAAEMGGYDTSGIREVTASELERPAPRPRNSRLSSVVLRKCGLSELPNWKDSLRRHLLGT